MLCNHGTEDWTIDKGDRIAQIVFEKYMKNVEWIEETLTETKRGADGFGSTEKRETTKYINMPSIV